MPKKKTEDPTIIKDISPMDDAAQEQSGEALPSLSDGGTPAEVTAVLTNSLTGVETNGAAGEDSVSPEPDMQDTSIEQPADTLPADKPQKTRRKTAAKKTGTDKKKQAAVPDDLSEQNAPDKNSAASAKPSRLSTEKKRFYDLDFRELDKDLSPQQREEWEAIYASYRSKSTLSGAIIGPEEIRYTVQDKETKETVTRKIPSAAIVQYRVKVLIPETEMWMPGEERPEYVMRNMTQGAVIDYVILEVDRENECAIASRRLALATKRHYFATVPGGHHEGEMMKCRVLAVGAKKCLVEVGGYDLTLTQRDLSYTAIADLRERYVPGMELDCKLKVYDRRENKLVISVKEVNPNPFDGADRRHPVGSRRQAVISGKYGGGVFCTLPDDTVCLCLYSPQHQDNNFRIGDNVMVAISQYDYRKKLIYGRILARW